MKRVTTAALFSAILLRAGEALAADPVAYVNLQRAILEVDEGRRAKDALKKTFEKKQAELTKREAELKALKDKLDAKSVVADDKQTRTQQLEFQNKLMELQQTFVKEQKDLQELEQKELSAITEKMKGIIKEIGQSSGYQLILEVQESRLLFAKPHLDLTNEVIRKYNGKYK